MPAKAWTEGAKWIVEGRNMRWVHFENPTIRDIDRLATQLRVPKDYLSAVLDPDEVARVENLEAANASKNLVLLFPVQTIDANKYTVYEKRPLAIVLLRDAIVTCVQRTPSFMEKIHARYRAIRDSISQEHLILEICWEISYEFIKDLRKIDRLVDEIEGNLRKGDQSENLYHMVSITKSLVNIDTALKANNEVYDALEGVPSMNGPANKHLLRDVRVENNQALKMGQSSYRMLTELREIYSGIISTNLNNTMEFLTLITILMTIPTIVGGIWGMNVKLPWEREPLAFWILMGLTAILMFATYKLLKKRNLF